jgi:hypothetical protein
MIWPDSSLKTRSIGNTGTTDSYSCWWRCRSAVVGVDTHRDTHEVEIALPTGTPIATCQISNDIAGFAELLAWIVDQQGMTPERGRSGHLRGLRANNVN